MSIKATDEADEICASCGIPACDINIKWKLCNACKSGRYCSVELFIKSMLLYYGTRNRTSINNNID
eukprot:scaffold18466_cov87-Skeletonema_dohrnii-CCMP3373.AAC.5